MTNILKKLLEKVDKKMKEKSDKKCCCNCKK